VASKILYSIALLNSNGLSLGEKYIHRIWGSKHSLWELRIRLGNDRERVMFFTLVDGKFLLTRCFNKITAKVPSIEIQRSERIYEQYLKDLKKKELMRSGRSALIFCKRWLKMNCSTESPKRSSPLAISATGARKHLQNMPI
jgi:phage-related protein